LIGEGLDFLVFGCKLGSDAGVVQDESLDGRIQRLDGFVDGGCGAAEEVKLGVNVGCRGVHGRKRRGVGRGW